MKLYTFTSEDNKGKIIEEVRAENHAQAVERAVNKEISNETDFYSETLEGYIEQGWGN